ncbi:MAG TPA: acyl carrier protein [Magnetospirillaceae bacterium]|jgi:acyl carrier protein
MSNSTLASVIEIISTQSPLPQIAVKATTDLFGEQVLDSFGILELIGALEQQLGVALPTEELTQQNFASPTTIAALIDRIRAG